MPEKGVEYERLKHINFVMNEIHDSNNEIYELLVEQQ